MTAFRVWKYVLPTTSGDRFSLRLPANYVTLDVQVQLGRPCLWVEVDQITDMVTQHFQWVGTGHQTDATGIQSYIGTVQLSEYVFHLYAVEGQEQS